MGDWLIIRTKRDKEQYVAKQIRNAGFDAWIPCEVRTQRICRHVKRRETTHHPILPRTLFAAVPVALQAELSGVRHLDSIERNAAQEAICVPHSQIHAFRVEIDKMNAAALALSQTASKKQKAKWKALKDGLLEAMAKAAQELEQAA